MDFLAHLHTVTGAMDAKVNKPKLAPKRAPQESGAKTEEQDTLED